MRMSDFYIGNIYIIAKKQEPRGLVFENPSREWHGFVLIISGEGSFFGPRGEERISGGDLILLGRGCRYGIRLANGSEYITSAFDVFIENTAATEPFPAIVKADEITVDRMLEVERLFCAGDRVECRLLLTEIYSAVLSGLEERGESGGHAERAASIIGRRFRDSISIPEIARECNVSESYLRSSFRARFGVSMSAYRERLRIREAENLLRSGFFSVKEIAERLGYCDVFHFTKAFSRGVGETPAAYRDRFANRK